MNAQEKKLMVTLLTPLLKQDAVGKIPPAQRLAIKIAIDHFKDDPIAESTIKNIVWLAGGIREE